MDDNWKRIIERSKPYFDSYFEDRDGVRWRFIGVIHASDDYYYAMLSPDGEFWMLSCVGSFETHGFKALGVRDYAAAPKVCVG